MPVRKGVARNNQPRTGADLFPLVMIPPTYRTGQYHGPSVLTSGYFSWGSPADWGVKLTAEPFIVQRRIRIDRIGTTICGTGGTGAVVRLGIYYDNGESYPGSLLLDAGTVDAESSTGWKELTIDVTLEPGLYWLVFFPNDPTIDFRSSGYGQGGKIGLGISNPGAGSWFTFGDLYYSMTYGSLPSTFPTGASGE